MANEDLTGLATDAAPPAESQQPPEAAPQVTPEFASSAPSDAAPIGDDLADAVPDANNLDMLLDVNLHMTVELGRAQVKFRDVLNLSSGSIVELSKQTSEPVDILVNGALLATGEVVVIDDHFAVRINKLLNRVERLQRVI